MPRTKSQDPAVKKSISMPASLYKRMLERMKALGFNSESAYVQFLTRNDVVRKDAAVIAVETHTELKPDGKEKKGKRGKR
jgi:hypothetical protein